LGHVQGATPHNLLQVQDSWACWLFNIFLQSKPRSPLLILNIITHKMLAYFFQYHSEEVWESFTHYHIQVVY
jgi:hypothetical protein